VFNPEPKLGQFGSIKNFASITVQTLLLQRSLTIILFYDMLFNFFNHLNSAFNT
jgi:hypothetical protein